jgi:hypothetical protein
MTMISEEIKLIIFVGVCIIIFGVWLLKDKGSHLDDGY